jgi:phosphoglycerol transferase MdoB-like AlkP superfamily enzyme
MINFNIKPLQVNIHLALLLRFLLALLFFTICRVIYYVINIGYFPDLSIGTILKIFYGGVLFDISGLLFILSLYIISQVIPFKIRHNKTYQKITSWFFIVPLTVGIIANLADAVYYQITLKRTTAVLFEQFSNETNMGKLVAQFMLDYWYMVIIAIILIFVLYKTNKKITVKEAPIGKNWIYFFTSIGITILVITASIIGVRGGYKHSSRPITLSNASKYTNNPNQRALVLNTPFTLIKTVNKIPLHEVNYFASQKEQERIFSAFHSGENKTDSLYKKKNIVVIILESFGSEHISALNKDIKGYKGFTPFLDSLIGQSYTFKHAFANGRKSIEGMSSCLASIPSLKTPFVLSHYSGNEINSLANLLRPEGYYSAFFHGAPNGSMGFDAFTKQAGFDDYFGMNEYGNDNHFDGFWGIWDEEFFQYYANEMNKMKEPFVTSIFSVSSHHPFNLPERYDGVFPEGKLRLQKTIGYTDYALKQFFETAKKMPWFKNTIFVITADHASTFTDLPEYKTPNGFFAVPLIIYDPSNPNLIAFNDTDVVQQIDIMPTLMNMIGYQKDYIAFGSDMLDPSEPHFAMTFIADIYYFFSKGYLLQYHNEILIGIYNYENDPLFKHNLVFDKRNHQPELLKLCLAFIQEHNRRMIRNELTVK